MVSSLHASKEDSYYQAYAQLQAALALPSATFDGPTVRAAAVAAFHAEQRRRSSTSRAPDSVLAFAASTGFRRPTTGTSTPASSCCRCPHHCVLPGGTFRVVRPVEDHLSAVPDRNPFADVSDKTIKTYQAYKAAIEDPHSSWHAVGGSIPTHTTRPVYIVSYKNMSSRVLSPSQITL